MIGTTRTSTAFAHPASWLADRDSTWYGTLGVLTAGVVVLAVLVLSL